MIVDVAVPYRVARTFHYLADDKIGNEITQGSIIQIPFRNRSTYGYVLGFPEKSEVEPARLKHVEEVLVSDPLFDQKMLKFLQWVSDYYCHPLGEVLAAAIPKPCWEQKKRRKHNFETESEYIGTATERPEHTDEQQFAISKICAPETNRPILLYGVTGSGKTEVYMSVLEELTTQHNRTGLVLVPEISLTPQLLGRFTSRFGRTTAVLHSDLTPRERYIEWQRIYRGHAKIVIGARSAVFAPLKNLGLIVIDEEHEGSFKQEDSVRYHARDIAIVRAKIEGAKVILGSATPSVESYANCLSGKYEMVSLKNASTNVPCPPRFSLM